MAAVDYYLKIDGIEGESPDSKHKNEIDIESWSWGQKQPHDAATGMSTGRVRMEPFQFTMLVNKASPKLFLACATGQHIKEGLLICRRAGKEQQEYLKIKFTDLMVSSFQTGGSEDQVVPLDKIELVFHKIEVSYAAQNADGKLASPVVHKYNVRENAGA